MDALFLELVARNLGQMLLACSLTGCFFKKLKYDSYNKVHCFKAHSSVEVLVYTPGCVTSALSNSRTVPSPPEETLYPLAVRADAFFNASASSLRSMQDPDSLHERVLKILAALGSNPGILDYLWIFLGQPRRKPWCNSPAAGKGGLHTGLQN